MPRLSTQENRRYKRYDSQQKGIMTTRNGVNALCIIRNFGRGGTHLAMIGSKNPDEGGRIGLKAQNQTYDCTIVGMDSIGIHCKFIEPINEENLRVFVPEAPLIGQEQGIWLDRTIARERIAPPSPAPIVLPPSDPPPDRLAASLPANLIGSSLFGRIYAEGWSVGRDQLDPVIGPLEATMVALNPYRLPPESDCWNAGFRDGLLIPLWLMRQ
ncbi:hypothetical protein [Magnetospirillum molischianum]|uniref:Uncharacterized protein n=1 Tax=Magnetospirillum molischianum DSM 120 TaxID=1150626 RepID=H8FMU3_MAGML|nr:hypothetical protein [Magnetospirillum molischianum]CCG39681.1 hypothetical protein PHAMO_10106 [Magnetospirillum molischianum DSM 120]